MRVEFSLISAMEVSHMAPIVRQLRTMDVDAMFVVPRNMEAGWDGPFVIEAVLRREGLPYTNHGNRNADIAITCQNAAFLADYRGLKGRLMYGVGLVKPEHQDPLGVLFDFHLVHGPLTERIQFSAHSLPSPNLSPEKVKAIGYPRFDACWYKMTIEHAGPPRLLWLPTWDDRSSIDDYAEEIFGLSPEYQILVKPHHGTVNHEPDRIELLESGPVEMIDFTELPEKTFERVNRHDDIVVADYSSGAFSEAALLNKRVVGIVGATEVLRSMYDLVPTTMCYEAGTLPARVREAVRATDVFKSQLFTTTHGHDAEVAAKAIMEFAS